MKKKKKLIVQRDCPRNLASIWKAHCHRSNQNKLRVSARESAPNTKAENTMLEV